MIRWMRTAGRRSRYHGLEDKPYNNTTTCGWTVLYSRWEYELVDLPPPAHHPFCRRCFKEN